MYVYIYIYHISVCVCKCISKSSYLSTLRHQERLYPGTSEAATGAQARSWPIETIRTCSKSQWNSIMGGISPKFLAQHNLKILRLAIKIWVNILTMLAHVLHPIHSICQLEKAYVRDEGPDILGCNYSFGGPQLLGHGKFYLKAPPIIDHLRRGQAMGVFCRFIMIHQCEMGEIS